MSHTTKDLKKQLGRIRRIKGQVEAIERALQGDRNSEDILQLVASYRGALNGLMAGLIEGHVRITCFRRPLRSNRHRLRRPKSWWLW